MDVADANEALDDLIDRLKDKGVRAFKGQLLHENGSPLWNLDIVFERPPAPRRSNEDTE